MSLAISGVSETTNQPESQARELGTDNEGQYRPLSDPKLHLRLLRFLGREGSNGPFSLSLTPVPLEPSSRPDYIALSYEWDPPSTQYFVLPQQPIINNKRRRITANLGLALEALYSNFGRSEYFWIDALCINQQDLVEKNDQVRLMGTIYSSAKTVAIWLGFQSTLVKQHGVVNTLIQLLRTPNAQVEAEVVKALLNPEFEAEWDGWSLMATSTYWTRCWILQEIHFARDCQLMFAQPATSLQQTYTRIDFSGMTELCRLITVCKRRLLRQSPEHPLRKIFLPPPPHFWLTTRKYSLLKVLRLYASQLSKDPRDRVYALLSLAQEYYDVPPLAIDYGLPVSEVFRRTAEYIIRGEGPKTLSILSCAGHDVVAGLPSWVPKWDDWKAVDREFSVFSAFREHRGPAATFHLSGDCLEVQACIIGRASLFDTPRVLTRYHHDGTIPAGLTIDRANHLIKCVKEANSELIYEMGNKTSLSPVPALLKTLSELMLTNTDGQDDNAKLEAVALYEFLRDLDRGSNAGSRQLFETARNFSVHIGSLFDENINLFQFQPSADLPTVDKLFRAEPEEVREAISQHQHVFIPLGRTRLRYMWELVDSPYDVVAIAGCRTLLMLEGVMGIPDTFRIMGPAQISGWLTMEDVFESIESTKISII